MKINIKRLNHVQICIPVGAEETARNFYGKILGLEAVEKPEPLKAGGGMWYKIADIQLHIGVEEAAERSKRHPAFEVENIDAVREYLQTNGVTTRDEIPLPRLRRFSFFDPFGNRIEFLERYAEEPASA